MGRHDTHIPQDEGYASSLPEEQVIYSRAETGDVVAYSRPEYGVRKDDGGGLVKPVTTARGLLVLALLASAFDCLVLYGLIRIAIDGTWEILAETWWVLVVGTFVPAVCWSYYFKERKAGKLRKARNLPRPIE